MEILLHILLKRNKLGFPAVYCLYRYNGITVRFKTARNAGILGNNPYTVHIGINGIKYSYTVENPRKKAENHMSYLLKLMTV